MACQEVAYPWTQTIRRQFPELSKPQAAVLALWSLGMVLARSCALTAVSLFLATWQGRQEGTIRQQLREWCYPAGQKRGEQRQELDVTACFVPLLRWVLASHRGNQLTLALDATSLGERFVVLTLSVVYRGCAIPVACTGKQRRLRCTLLACWAEGCRDPWLLLTDLPPEAAEAGWYGMRAWIEQGFKITKRAGWQWQRTRMDDPNRAARLWLAVAVASLWLLLVGGEAEEDIPDSTLHDLTPALATQRRHAHPRQRRRQCGSAGPLASALAGGALPCGCVRRT